MKEEKSLLLYNPKGITLEFGTGPKLLGDFVIISIKKFHSLFSSEADYILFEWR
jgi:hypothetical protein